jgi:hypothetical protein
MADTELPELPELPEWHEFARFMAKKFSIPKWAMLGFKNEGDYLLVRLVKSDEEIEAHFYRASSLVARHAHYKRLI